MDVSPSTILYVSISPFCPESLSPANGRVCCGREEQYTWLVFVADE